MSCFEKVLSGNETYEALKRSASLNGCSVGIVGQSQLYKAHLIHSLCEKLSSTALVVTPDEASAVKFVSDLTAMGSRAFLFPYRDPVYSSDQTVSREYEHMRLCALSNMLKGKYDIIAAPVSAVCQKTIDRSSLKSHSAVIKRGQELEEENFCELLLKNGYTRSESVEGIGQFSQRGGITDFFPPDRKNPVRIEFWGDTVDTIAEFDVLSQRRFDSREKITVSPVNEILISDPLELADKIDGLSKKLHGEKNEKIINNLNSDSDKIKGGIRLSCLDRYFNLVYGEGETIFDYLNRDSIVFVSESSDVKIRCNAYTKSYNEDIREAFLQGNLCRTLDDLSIDFKEITRQYENRRVIFSDNFARGSFDIPINELYTVSDSTLSLWSGSFDVLINELLPDKNQKVTVVIATANQKSAATLCNDLAKEGIASSLYKKLPESFVLGQINIISEGFSAGMAYANPAFMLISHGVKRNDNALKKIRHKKAANSFHSLDELHKGDYVVHTSHGIGMFDGIVNLSTGGVKKDYLKIIYAGSDVLYVPVTQLDLIAKYIGPAEGAKKVKLSKIGGVEWKKTKGRVRAAVNDMADELIELYSKRMNTKGFAFSPDTDMQSDFERRFEYDETDDQLRCIAEIKVDMEKPFPMDRLLCGDVGFGKTEVALRAAFKCVAEGKQCAILVPTTILAFQHYQTILKRFEGFPIETDMLSRFRTTAQQKKTITSLKRGSTDITVGTHRLLSDDVKFKDLGLLIIDEEQRFGVKQKEKIKEKFPNVDVLTLSATPIPRTLNMAMTGIRDMSIIEEAPADRFPVASYVTEYDDDVIKAAIEKELRRGGQVYYLYNRVESIAEKAVHIKEMFPDANVDIAHGKMSENELSSAWQRLLEGSTDILICTTIIETGVDVPNANTLIIENADNLGLSQLHQIRGRIGRSSRRAFAYFTFVKGRQLSEIATGRLEAIREYTEFGSGFKIAMRDLELRGAGSILGSAQHGHMEAVGYDMYLKLLAEAVENHKGNKAGKEIEEKKDCLIDIRIDAYIPENYIDSVPGRLSMYRRIADVRNNEDAMDVTDELIDRYGEPPKCVLGLVEVSLLRNLAASLDIYEIGQRGDNLILKTDSIDMKAVTRLASDMRGNILVSAGTKPYISVKVPGKESELVILKKALTVLAASQKK